MARRSGSVGAIAGLALLTAAQAATGDGTTWYRFTAASGEQIGYSSEEIVIRPDGRDVIDTQQIDIDVPSDVLPRAPWFTLPDATHMSARTVRREDAGGRTISLSATAQSNRDVTRDEAVINADAAVVTHTVAAGTRTLSIALPPGVRFDGGDGLLKGWDPVARPRLEFDDFNLGALAVDHVTIEALPDATAPGQIVALRKRCAGTVLITVARLTIDRDGRIAEAHQPMFGTDFEIVLATREAALQAHAPYRLLSGAMAKSPYRILDDALHGHIRYRFGFRDGIVFPLAETGEQRATQAANGVTLDICAACGPGLPSDAAYLADARKPAPMLQSDAPQIVAIAAPVAKLALSDTQKMDLLTHKVVRLLPHIDFVGHYSALDALARRAGDCTESAALLAALGRAAGIPTRVANGLVYSRERYHGVSNVFMPHSWVIAWVDGTWKSFDAALGDFDSTHIALSINDGDQRSAFASQQLAGLLRWDGMQEVKARPVE
ncbi:MAG TPA: transglutaminase domain-containing protein [Rhizomicrobium sp.]|jgi:hypothetical protein|nr:transglutaminase domain-containing protein [Rhizomicrobium sp.]